MYKYSFNQRIWVRLLINHTWMNRWWNWIMVVVLWMVVMWNISLIFTFLWNGNQFAFIFFINGINGFNGFNGFNGIIWFDFFVVIVIVLLFQRFLIYVRFISYSKCSNWRWISKLSSNFGCLFTFCYLDGANSIKTDLHICNL